jgi:adenylate kinase
MVILLFGPPGSGKGTQAPFISSLLGIPAISTGETFRAERDSGTPLGKKVSAIMSSGGLVSDDIVNEVVASRLRRDDCRNGFVLDGYPRTVPQGVFLDELLKSINQPGPTVLFFDVPDVVLVRRLTARRQCPTCGRIYNLLFQPPLRDEVCNLDGSKLFQRSDDKEEVIRTRLQAYAEQTGPLIDYYSNRDFHRLDATLTPAEIQKEVQQILQPTV